MKSFVLSQEIREHQNRVAILASEFAKQLGVKDSIISKIFTSSIHHDIGKAKIDDALLEKPSYLTEEEMNTIKSHAIEGAKILLDMKMCSHIVNSVLHHHEAYDGTGYPHKLKGKEIPFTSRILKICDVYDALVYKRCYRPIAYTRNEALEIMDSMQNEFDPELYSKFKSYIMIRNKEPAEADTEVGKAI